MSPEPKSYDELVEASKALTDPKKRRWAYRHYNQPRQILRPDERRAEHLA